MLRRDEIKYLLHANCVVPLQTTDVHGPLGLEHVARDVAEIMRMSAETVAAAIIEQALGNGASK